jgi:hypothetical protein
MVNLSFRGPDVAVIGWIPFYKNLAQLPGGHHYRESLAMHLLFNTGNNEPPTHFDSYDDFSAWLSTGKEYRGAVYMRDIHLRYEDDKPAPIFSYEAQGIMGYTPAKLVVGNLELTPPDRLRYHKGQAPSDYAPPLIAVLSGNRGVNITFRYQFKLSPMMDLIQRAITGRRAPNAWAKIEYEIYKSGSVRLLIRGTAIPSQHIYINWRRADEYRHDMMSNGRDRIDGFLNETPGCDDAPAVTRQQFIERATSVI